MRKIKYCIQLLLFPLIGFMSCKDKQKVAPPALSSPFLIEFSVKSDPSTKVAISYIFNGQKHYILLFPEVQLNPIAADTIAKVNFLSAELFYRAADTTFEHPAAYALYSTPNNINNFSLEYYKNNQLIETHKLFCQVHYYFDKTLGFSNFKYNATLDGTPLPIMAYYQNQPAAYASNGKIGYVLP